jgi:poly(beta-D-mannuronate) lyase
MKNTFLLLLCLCCVNLCLAKVYKVANADEFKKATDAALPGDEIVIANGNYTAWAQIVATNGTAQKPIIIHAETDGIVTFSGDVTKPIFKLTGSYTELSGISFTACNVFKEKNIGTLVELSDAKYCRLNNCLFTKNTAKVQFTPIVVISGKGEHNRVDHCNFISNIDNQEVQVKITAESAPQHTLIDNNLFSDKAKVSWANFNGGECVQVGQEPVLLGTQIAHTTVRNNRFIRCGAEPEVISNKSSGNSYISNYFEDCHSELVMRGGHDCLIDSNTIKGGSCGIRINGSHHTITNNNITGVKTAIRLMYGMAKGKTETGFYVAAGDCIIKNNHISNTDTGILIGDSKNADWTGKFDAAKLPSRTMQDVAPYSNTIDGNVFTSVKTEVVHNEKP